MNLQEKIAIVQVLVRIFFLLPLSPSTHLNQIKFLLNSRNVILSGWYVVFTNHTYPKFSPASYSSKRFPRYTLNARPKRFPRYTPNARPKRLPRYSPNAMPEIIPWLRLKMPWHRLKMRTPCMLSYLILQAPTATESDPITKQLQWCFWRLSAEDLMWLQNMRVDTCAWFIFGSPCSELIQCGNACL